MFAIISLTDIPTRVPSGRSCMDVCMYMLLDEQTVANQGRQGEKQL